MDSAYIDQLGDMEHVLRWGYLLIGVPRVLYMIYFSCGSRLNSGLNIIKNLPKHACLASVSFNYSILKAFVHDEASEFEFSATPES